ncbi:hypothetical protein [uncultured Brachyspira sp.]|uniref:hypothetical protein n=1 Tax=uncultured Brachyspira sp. TaxID=221953 RepID=UPI00261C618F|nr:hypothetical protein [uncultured Brachyspira sp.]
MNLLDKNRLNTGLNGEWLNDDEENGIHGTVLMAEDMNSLGTEINNLIKAGGMTPNKNENDQILRAVKNLGGSGVASSASNISYDNSISSLEQKNYDFPKFKSQIADLTYISLTESSVIGKIEKEDDNYFIKGSVSVLSSQNVLSIPLTIDGKENYEVLSFIGQFFSIDYGDNIENWTDTLENEIIVNGINNGWQFVFVQNVISIKRKDNGELPENTYSVTLNIKNRVLLKPDENIIAWQYEMNNNTILKIVNENGTLKIKGITNIYASVRSEDTIFFTNNILENYVDFNIEHTSGITSSNGKNVIWTFKKNYQGFPYSIVIKYEDESGIEPEDFFTIDITPDKNSNIDFTKGDAVNVQNAIDSLSELKQDKLIAGENIVIEKQGESTIIKSLGGGNAEDIGFDNTNAKLQQLAGYDFPKFKTEIPETIDFIAGEKQTIAIKKIDNNYFIQYKFLSLFMPSLDFYLMLSDTNLYKTYSLLNQFFQTVSTNEEIYYDALEGEIVWEEITNIEELQSNPDFILPDGSFNLDLIKTNPLQVKSKFKITNGINSYNYLMIKNEALEEIQPSTYCVLTLNIKNRVLRNEDTNIFTSSFAFMTTQSIMDFYAFTLEQDNNNIKLKGSYTLKDGAGLAIGFYSPIIENYFNVSNAAVNLQNTSGITSSNGKPLKFGIFKNNKTEAAEPPYILFLCYQDDTNIQAGDAITFNLTPDKNFMLNPIYQNVINVQQAIEAIVKRLTILES